MGLIEQIYLGNQTGETVTQLANQTKEIIAFLRAKKKPIIILEYFIIASSDNGDKVKTFDTNQADR
ncbi:MAG: hypothetical protein Q8O75_03245 [bacterium]|nr:hypothetical protein [bacterium]